MNFTTLTGEVHVPTRSKTGSGKERQEPHHGRHPSEEEVLHAAKSAFAWIKSLTNCNCQSGVIPLVLRDEGMLDVMKVELQG